MRIDRVFIDTNILLSGLAFTGNEARLLKLALKQEVLLVICDKVLLEARTTGIRKFPWILVPLDELLRDANCEFLPRPGETFVKQASLLVRDPDDVEILASILDSRHDVALTGDKDLLTDEVKTVAPMCTCAEFLRKLAQ